jgi:hypothetical protein
VVLTINENTNSKLTNLEKAMYAKTENDNRTKLESIKNTFENLIQEAEKRNGGIFKKDDFTDLVNQLKAVVNAIR